MASQAEPPITPISVDSSWGGTWWPLLGLVYTAPPELGPDHPMTDRSWMLRRVVLALALMVSFYLLAIGVAFGLLWIAYADVTYTKMRIWKLVAFCVIGAGTVLWAIIPRPDRFVPPGPRVERSEEPDLFALIDEIAHATQQAPPSDVYLTSDMNAFVAQRGGVMGIGSHRVMGLGLPLMQALTVNEFRAVLAHEFGHFHSGDVALGPWIHKTRAAITRAIQRLEGNVLQAIFVAYGNLFLRITHAVSRQQEFIADQVAAGIAGSSAIASGLRKLVGASYAFNGYWHGELGPVMAAGYRPPVIAGFAQYMQNEKLAAFMASVADAEQSGSNADVYDTHPSLKERLSALGAFSNGTTADERPATALLRDVSDSERRVLTHLSADLADLKPIEWPKVGEVVYVPMWNARLKAHGAVLPELAIGRLAPSKEMLLRLGRATVTGEREADESECLGRAWQLLMAGVGLSLVPRGWTPVTIPGEELILRRGTDEFRPYTEINAVIEGTTSAEQYAERLRVLGIGRDGGPRGDRRVIGYPPAHESVRLASPRRARSCDRLLRSRGRSSGPRAKRRAAIGGLLCHSGDRRRTARSRADSPLRLVQAAVAGTPIGMGEDAREGRGRGRVPGRLDHAALG